jgi:hypothetical protein
VDVRLYITITNGFCNASLFMIITSEIEEGDLLLCSRSILGAVKVDLLGGRKMLYSPTRNTLNKGLGAATLSKGFSCAWLVYTVCYEAGPGTEVVAQRPSGRRVLALETLVVLVFARFLTLNESR